MGFKVQNYLEPISWAFLLCKLLLDKIALTILVRIATYASYTSGRYINWVLQVKK